MSRLEVRRSIPYQETESATVQVFRIATKAPWYTGNRKIHDDLGVPYFSDHIRSLTERFDSKLADVGNPLLEQLGTHLRRPSVDLRPLIRGNQYRQLVLVTRKVVADTSNRANWNFSATLTEVFPCFSSVVRQMPGYNLQRRGMPRTLPKLDDNFYAASPSLTLV